MTEIHRGTASKANSLFVLNFCNGCFHKAAFFVYCRLTNKLELLTQNKLLLCHVLKRKQRSLCKNSHKCGRALPLKSGFLLPSPQQNAGKVCICGGGVVQCVF